MVEKDEGVEGLVLGGSGDFLVDGEVGEESLDLRSAHLARMTLLMEKDVALDPENVNFLGAKGVMFHAEDFADLIEEFGFGVGDDEGLGTDGS